MRDLRYAIRTLVRSPGFSSMVVLTLALGIGATTVVFDLLNLFFWRRPPIERPQDVVSVYTTHPQPFVGPYGALSWPDFVDYREAAKSARLIAYLQTFLPIDAGSGAAEGEVYLVTGDFFSALGIPAAVGRTLGPDDDRAGAEPVAVISHSLWQKLGSDADVLGRALEVGELSLRVVGVAPPRFGGLVSGSRVEVLVAAEVGLDLLGENERTDRSLHAWSVLARLPRASQAALRAELALIANGLDREHRLPSVSRGITVQPAILGHPIDQMRIGTTLWIFSAAVGLLLLIACANVSNLLLARAIGRRREMGIRQSVGASRGRLVRQLLTESLVLAFAGGTCGLLLALAVRRLMVGYFGQEFVAFMRFDHRVLGLTLLVSCAVTLLFGLAPALVTSRVQLVTALKDAAPSGALRARLSTRSLLAVLQVALAMVLLLCCGLLVDDLWRSRSAYLGFDTANLLVTGVELPERVEPAEGRAFFRRLREHAESIPGVRAAGTTLWVAPVMLDITIGLHLPEQPEEARRSRFDIVDSESFATLGVPLLEGRLFEPQDEQSHRGVALVNRVLADQLWPGQPALGRTIRLDRARPGDPGTDYEIVGVVGSVTQFSLARSPEPVVYFSWAQRYRQSLRLLLRTDGIDPDTVFATLRDELRGLDPTLILHDPRTHDEARWEALVDQRLQTQTVGLFGGAGLFLALLGVFGAISYSVNQQLREIGIRIAVGARQADVLRWVLRRGLMLAGGGVAMGWIASTWAVQLLRSAVPGLGPAPPALYAGAALFLLVASTAAVWLPARRAAGVDPLQVLRQG
ncbi:MAG TPA: ABC transporter permease [Thermoanaerobaculia bacterium]|nr:ABC transporter permease [Thermoanaerobaculia bacterium]